MSLRAAALLAVLAVPALAAEVEQTTRESYGAFLQGRYDDAASGWRYLSGLGATGPRPEANEALAERDAGRPETALPLWIKASLAEGADGLVWNQRAWSSLSVGRLREAKESFEKAIDRSSTTETQAEADLGLGLTAILDDKPKAALEPLRRAGVAGPYSVAAAAQLTAEAAATIGDQPATLSYLRQALDVDPYDREALRALVRFMDRVGDNRGAWLAARRALWFDPADEEAQKVLKRNARFVTGDPDAASGVRRVARPLLDANADEPPLPKSSRAVRVGLFGAPNGKPASMTRAYLMSNAPFKVTAAAYGALRDNGNAYDQWEVEFRPDTNVVEVRDSARNLLFVSKQPFAFVPQSPRGSILVKSAKITDPVGVDLGDRETRGSVEVIPNPWGFRLVAETPLELYLYGVVSMALPSGSPPEAYKAQAVVSRTAALWAMGHRPPTLERYDLLDDRSVQPTVGVSGEMREAGDGVLATEGLALTENGLVTRAPQHEDSGGRTEDGRASGEPGLETFVSVDDGPRPLASWTTPLDFERFVHEPPPEGLYSEAAPGRSAATARWVRVLDVKDIRARVDQKKRVGRVRALRVTGRTDTGRVKGIEVVGADGSVVYTGFEELQRLLSPGSLRSTLFSLQPVYDGKSVSRVILWGAGTGHGVGYSRAGGVGQAALGKPWRDILKHYFPRQEVRSVDHPTPLPSAAGAPVKGVGPYRRTLNYRLQKDAAGKPPAPKPSPAPR
ncbi:MAG: SpoIID/LytB domain-containing protein [Elusimicrobia bacterium]|nr:SpoIID/LytB domain-containing protein [Elusimicrobiota bacterium]